MQVPISAARVRDDREHRGQARRTPYAPAPYIAQVGLFGRPTLEHNFETLYWVRDIVERGPQWFASFGRHGRMGLRSFSVSGRVKHPGVKLAPAGITVQELIDEYCGGMLNGHELYAYLPGGASGGILPASPQPDSAGLRHAAALRLLHRLGRRHRAQPARSGARRSAECDALF